MHTVFDDEFAVVPAPNATCAAMAASLRLFIIVREHDWTEIANSTWDGAVKAHFNDVQAILAAPRVSTTT